MCDDGECAALNKVCLDNHLTVETTSKVVGRAAEGIEARVIVSVSVSVRGSKAGISELRQGERAPVILPNVRASFGRSEAGFVIWLLTRGSENERDHAEARLREDNLCVLLPIVDTPWRACCVTLAALCAPWVMAHGRHRACIRFAVWHSEVVVALMQHGTYNPATNHEPLPGEELDALERREEFRDLLRGSFPAIAEVFYGEEHPDAD